MRAVFFGLILANVAMLVMHAMPMKPEGVEPERLAQQLHPELITVIDPEVAAREAVQERLAAHRAAQEKLAQQAQQTGAAPAASTETAPGASAQTAAPASAAPSPTPSPTPSSQTAAAAAPTPPNAAAPATTAAQPSSQPSSQSSSQSSSQTPAQPPTATPPTAPAKATAANSPTAGESGSPPLAQAVCVELGDFTAQASESFEPQLSRLSMTGIPQRRIVQPPPSYLVFLPPQPTEAAASRRLAELRQKGFADSAVMRDDSPRRWGVSAGLFSKEELAIAHLDKLHKAGFADARMGEHPLNSTRYAYRLPGVTAAGATRLAAVASGYAGVSMRPCK